ncbi:MAG: hypothetical protein MJZ25_10650 [Fibrobacter sp.]|nr:hypothetical protein [Fibrobacter sp.]
MAGTLKDSRDGKTYKTVEIGNQTWMAENLNYETSESKCYDNKESNCKRMGRLYTWDAAMDACPDGWSLPNNSDFSELKSFVESKVGEGNAGSVLKGRTFDMSVEGALEYDDRFGFSGQAAGDRIKNAYKFLGETAYLWSSSEGDDSRAFDWVLSSNSDDFFQGNIKFALKKNGFSVRCIKKSASNSKTEEEIRDDRANDSNEGDEVSSQRSEAQPPSGTLKDSRDGKTYKTVKMPDGKTWMAENLNYGTKDSWCYDNDPANCKKYGRLYTWGAAKKACPAGWRLPSKEDLESLLSAVGTSGDERSLNLRARSWENGSDKFGFSALPAGDYRSDYRKFHDLGNVTSFWASTERDRYYYAYSLDIVDSRANVNFYVKDGGGSVRCFRDSNGDKITDARDGKTYETVKMPDGKTWMAENLNYGTKDSWCYDNDPANCKKYGRLYTWEAAKMACPSGWRLPSKEELESLLAAAGSSQDERYQNLRAGSWENGSDKFGFSALPAGNYYSRSEKFDDLDDYTSFWSSTEYDSNRAYSLYINDYVASVNYNDKGSGRSVRCLQDN